MGILDFCLFVCLFVTGNLFALTLINSGIYSPDEAGQFWLASSGGYCILFLFRLKMNYVEN